MIKLALLKNYKLLNNSGLVVNLLSILSLFIYESIFSMLVSILNIVLLYFLLNNKRNWFLVIYGKNWNRTMIMHQVKCVISVGLVLLFFDFQATSPLYSIILAIHAMVILFITLKNQFKILNKMSIVLFSATLLKVIFWDINGINSSQKVHFLILLRLLLLSASYGYVKL